MVYVLNFHFYTWALKLIDNDFDFYILIQFIIYPYKLDISDLRHFRLFNDKMLG